MQRDVQYQAVFHISVYKYFICIKHSVIFDYLMCMQVFHTRMHEGS